MCKYVGCVADINECNNDPCDVNAQCTNTEGSFMCTCNTGYTGNGLSCAGAVAVY